jgi:hypothetical protein
MVLLTANHIFRYINVDYWMQQKTVNPIIRTQVIVCTADNSWWWAQKMPETCKFRDKIKFWILDAFFGYLYEDYHDARSLEHESTNIPPIMIINGIYKNQNLLSL